MLKPKELKIGVGTQRKITITAPHMDNKGLLSIPAITDKEEKGNFPLNTTILRALTPVLGDDTDKWVGATFTVVAIPANIPSGGQTLGWAVVDGSAKKPSKKTEE